MKREIMKIGVSIAIAMTALHSFGQVDSSRTPNNGVPYRLFSTQNIGMFIKLDTRNGQMWQVAFSIKPENHSVTSLSSTFLVSKDNEVNDRFTLHPTQMIYEFILLDQLDGRTWQVQWSWEPNNRGIVPIQ